jgi:hypothetical protein
VERIEAEGLQGLPKQTTLSIELSVTLEQRGAGDHLAHGADHHRQKAQDGEDQDYSGQGSSAAVGQSAEGITLGGASEA